MKGFGFKWSAETLTWVKTLIQSLQLEHRARRTALALRSD